jgi:hypothetical protein
MNESKTVTKKEDTTPLNEPFYAFTSEPDSMDDKQVDHNELIPSRRRSNIGRRRSLVAYNESGAQHPLSIVPDDTVDHERTAALLKEQLANVPFAAENEGARRDSLAMLANSYDPTQLYKPDSISAIHIRVDLPKPVMRDRLVVDEFAKNSTNTVWINMVTQGLNEWVRIPVIVLRGLEDG